MVRLVTTTPGTAERGVVVGTSRSTAPDEAFGSAGSTGRDELARVPVGDTFFLQGWGKERVGSVTFRGRGGSSEFPVSTEILGERLGWPDFLDGLKKGIGQ